MTFEFSCDHCLKPYALPYERVKGRLLKVRCKNCQNLMIVRDPKRGQEAKSNPSEPQTMGAQTLFSLQAIPSREEEEARLSAHTATPTTTTPPPQSPPAPPALPSRSEAEASAQALTPSKTPQVSKTYRTENSVQVEIPKPTDEWAQEVVEDLDRPITREIKIDQLKGVRSSVDFRPAHIRYMPHFAALALLLGLAALIGPHLSSQAPQTKQAKPKPVREVGVTLNAAALQRASTQSATTSALTTSALTASELKEGVKPESAGGRSGPLDPAPTGLSATQAEQAETKPATAVKIAKSTSAVTSAQPPQKKRAKRRVKRVVKKPGLPQASIRQIVQQNTGSLSYCYQKIQKKSELGSVKTRLKFTVLPNGRTKPGSASLSGKHRKTKLERCISLAVQRWRFPAAEGESKVRYPLNFTPSF